jgi:hypothetical protein
MACSCDWWWLQWHANAGLHTANLPFKVSLPRSRFLCACTLTLRLLTQCHQNRMLHEVNFASKSTEWGFHSISVPSQILDHLLISLLKNSLFSIHSARYCCVYIQHIGKTTNHFSPSWMKSESKSSFPNKLSLHCHHATVYNKQYNYVVKPNLC